MKSIITFFNKLTIGKKVYLLIIPIISVLVTMKTAIFGLWLLISFDLLTGIRKNLYIKGKFKELKANKSESKYWLKRVIIDLYKCLIVYGKTVKSYLLRQTWRKTYEYGIGIIIVVIFESIILGVTPISLAGRTFTIAELSIIVPAAIELWSIFENFEAVSGENIFKRLTRFLPDKLVLLFKKDIKND